jgi:hypothetical protein
VGAAIFRRARFESTAKPQSRKGTRRGEEIEGTANFANLENREEMKTVEDEGFRSSSKNSQDSRCLSLFAIRLLVGTQCVFFDGFAVKKTMPVQNFSNRLRAEIG